MIVCDEVLKSTIYDWNGWMDGWMDGWECRVGFVGVGSIRVMSGRLGWDRI